MQNIVNIRRMCVSDMHEVMDIERKSFHTPWTEDMFFSEMSSRASFLWVYELDGKVVGYINGWNIASEVHINNIAVSENYRRRGIAEKLIKHVFTDDISAMTLEVRTTNISAIRLYEKLGFKVVGIRKNYYTDTGDDAYIMWHFRNEENYLIYGK